MQKYLQSFVLLLSGYLSSAQQVPLANQLFKQHNAIRTFHGLPSIQWNVQLAAALQQTANMCPGFQPINVPNVLSTQNMATFVACTNEYDCQRILGAAYTFYDQAESLWNYQAGACNSGNPNDCAAFTNIVDPSVYAMGCGWSVCQNDGYGGRYVWCNYVKANQNPFYVQPPRGSRQDLINMLVGPVQIQRQNATVVFVFLVVDYMPI